MTKHTWTPEQAAQLANLYPHTPGPALATMLGVSLGAVYNKAWGMGLKKTRATIAAMARAALCDPAHPAYGTRFQPGIVPWNKGTKFDSGGRSHETRFKPGDKPHTTLPIGAYRCVRETSTGRVVLEQKTSHSTGANHKRWTPVARLVWQAAHGPIPPKHIVVFKSGMHTHALEDITPDRLDCISRAEHAKRNHPRTKNPELGKLVQLKGAITRQVNRITREHAEHHTGATA